jgi:hypothetical protein
MSKKLMRFFCIIFVLLSGLVAIARDQLVENSGETKNRKERPEQSLEYDKYGFESNLGEYLVDD